MNTRWELFFLLRFWFSLSETLALWADAVDILLSWEFGSLHDTSSRAEATFVFLTLTVFNERDGTWWAFALVVSAWDGAESIEALSLTSWLGLGETWESSWWAFTLIVSVWDCAEIIEALSLTSWLGLGETWESSWRAFTLIVSVWDCAEIIEALSLTS